MNHSMYVSKLKHQFAKSSIDIWILDIGPLILITGFLWCKLIYFYFSLRNVWWYINESFNRWFIAHPDMLSMNLAILLLLASLVIFLPRISRFIVLILLDLLLTSLILADKLYVLMFADILSASEIVNAHMLLEVRESILDLLKPSYVGYYLGVIVGILLLPFYINKCKRIPPLDPKYIKHLFVGSLASSIIIAAPTFRLAWKDQYDLFASTSLQRDLCGTIGLLPYHIVDIASHVIGRNEKIKKGNLKRVEDFLENERKENNSESKLFGIAKGKNVILIMVESLNSFPIGLKVNKQLVTPKLSEFTKDSLYFVNIYDQAHLGKTSDAEFMSLQSLYPVAVGTVAGNFHSRSYFGLPAILSQHGYTTLSATGEAARFWNMNKMHKRIGFRQSFFQDSYNIRERIGRWLSDKEFFIQTVPILQEQREPFIAYLLTSSTHHPYKVPEKYKALNLGEMEGTTVGNYLHAVHYFDKEFGEFIDKLKEAGLLDKSIVVVYGDHAAPRIELNYISELLGYPTQNNYYTWLLQKRLPLIIRLPFGEAAGVRQITGGQLDIAPTILSILGVNYESNVMLGRDLTKDESHMVVFRDESFADGNYVFINRFGPKSLSTCYQASTGRAIDCKSLEEKRLRALERLEISDLIIHGDLIPALRVDINKAFKN